MQGAKLRSKPPQLPFHSGRESCRSLQYAALYGWQARSAFSPHAQMSLLHSGFQSMFFTQLPYFRYSIYRRVQ